MHAIEGMVLVYMPTRKIAHDEFGSKTITESCNNRGLEYWVKATNSGLSSD